MLLTGFLLLPCAQLPFLLQSRTTCSKTTHSQVVHPTLTISQENAFKDIAADQSDGGSSSSEVPSSQMTLACVKLEGEKKKNIIAYDRKVTLQH